MNKWSKNENINTDSLKKILEKDKNLHKLRKKEYNVGVLPHGQAVRQWTLTPRCVSSNLTGAAILQFQPLVRFSLYKWWEVIV